MSRYRKRVGSVSVDNNATSKIAAPQHWEQSPMPPVPAIPATLKHDGYGLANSPFPREMGDASPIDQTPTPFSSQHHRQLRHSERGTRNLNHQASDHESHPNEEREQRRMAERDNCESRRQVEEDAATYTERVSRSEQETDRKPVTPKRKTPEILQVSLANGQQFELRSPKARSPVVEKFVALTRRRKSKEGLSPTSSTAGSTAGSLDHAYGYGHGQVEPPEVPKLPIGIEVGGRGIVPQIDAPVSAVNHGDRVSRDTPLPNGVH